MDVLENILEVLDSVLDAKSKHHIVGGVLMSISLLFGGLAITVVTMKTEDDDNYGRFN